MNCQDCKFFQDEGHRLAPSGNRSTDETKNQAAGTCRRYAPSARNGNWRAWPTVIASDFCYDHQLREIAPPVANFATPIPVTVDSSPPVVIKPTVSEVKRCPVCACALGVFESETTKGGVQFCGAKCVDEWEKKQQFYAAPRRGRPRKT